MSATSSGFHHTDTRYIKAQDSELLLCKIVRMRTGSFRSSTRSTSDSRERRLERAEEPACSFACRSELAGVFGKVAF